MINIQTKISHEKEKEARLGCTVGLKRILRPPLMASPKQVDRGIAGADSIPLLEALDQRPDDGAGDRCVRDHNCECQPAAACELRL